MIAVAVTIFLVIIGKIRSERRHAGISALRARTSVPSPRSADIIAAAVVIPAAAVVASAAVIASAAVVTAAITVVVAAAAQTETAVTAKQKQ